MKLEFTGNRALILGGSCVLALQLAEHMIKCSLKPVLTWRSPAGKRKIQQHLTTAAGRYETCCLDFSRKNTLKNLTDTLANSIHFLVDFAQGDFEHLTGAAEDNAIQTYFDANVAFRALVIKHVSRAMLRQRQGRMVYISSTAAIQPNPGQGFYAAAKQASEAIYRNVGLEMGPKGVTTVILRPGYIAAGRGKAFIEQNNGPNAKPELSARLVSVRQVVETILFLLSTGGAGFNATALTMDKGLTAGK